MKPDNFAKSMFFLFALVADVNNGWCWSISLTLSFDELTNIGSFSPEVRFELANLVGNVWPNEDCGNLSLNSFIDLDCIDDGNLDIALVPLFDDFPFTSTP